MTHIAKGIESRAASCSLDEPELDGIAGGRMKLQGLEPIRTPSYGGGGDIIEFNPWSQHPVYLGPF